MDNIPIVEFSNVTKRFGENRVLDGVNLSVERGTVTAIIGKSGVGKSVLLKHAVGLIRPDSGQILINGKPLTKLSSKETHELKFRLSYMFQSNALFDSMTVYENIALPLRERLRLKDRVIRPKVAALTRKLELTDVLDRFPSQISGGMQKRVALARALITEPEVVLFDEPTTGLDPIRKNAVLGMIAHYQKEFGFTAIVISHDIPDIFYISDRVAILDGGRILFEGSPIELETAGNPLVSSFLNGLDNLKDDLTGLGSKQRFESRFNSLPAKTRVANQSALILLTIENLEEIDEHVGHIVTQRIIQTIAAHFQNEIGDYGFSARYDKNEIIGLAHQATIEHVETFAANLEQHLRTDPSLQAVPKGRRCRNFSVRIGFAHDDGKTPLPGLVDSARADQRTIVKLTCENSVEAA